MKKAMYLRVLACLWVMTTVTAAAWAIDVEITNITLGPAPLEVQIAVQTDLTGLPMSAFSVTENGVPMVLDTLTCGLETLNPVDVVFVIDRSRSMEDNIDSVASNLIGWIQSLPGNLDFRFGLVLYGQDLAPTGGCAPVSYAGSPKNETTDSLMHAQTIVNRLHAIALQNLVGGQEPAYHALQCALQATAWRTNAARYVVLVSDENNDTCQWHGAIPNIPEADLISQFQAQSATFYGWINYDVDCDCYDFCGSPRPPCAFFQHTGCSSGFEDFNPIAASTGGNTRNIDLALQNLLADIAIHITTHRTICYYSPCCYLNQPRTVAVTVNWNAETDTDFGSFTRTSCPPSLNPVVSCWTGNPATYVYGTPLVVCAQVTDGDNNVTAVEAIWSLGTCVSVTWLPATQVDGRWCITIPPNCTQSCATATITFRATDACGATHSATCTVQGPLGPADPIVCWTNNPDQFDVNTALSLCVVPQNVVNNITSVTAVYSTGIPGCIDIPVTVTALSSPTRWCATIPASCLTASVLSAQIVFLAHNQCGATSTTTCSATRNELVLQCCLYCEAIEPIALTSQRMSSYSSPVHLVAAYADGTLRLNWDAVPGANYYQILSSNTVDGELQVVDLALASQTEWQDQRAVPSPTDRQFFAVQPMFVAQEARARTADLGQWEMNEGTGPVAHDQSGNGFDALRWPDCPPDWSLENNDCPGEIGYLHFEGFVGHPDCAEHLRVANDNQWYRDNLQICLCLRIFDEPTIETGPYYIISNNTFSTAHGGFALRIDPGWFMVGSTREYHNRLTAMVWNSNLNNWMTIQSPPPQPSNPTLFSVPLDEWAQICWIIDGPNSMLLINNEVVAVGEQEFISDNNGAPLIIGAGYRHSTYPIEYPFPGDIDCIRILDRNEN